MEKSTLKRNSKVALNPQLQGTPNKLRKREPNLQLLTKKQLIDKVKDLEKELVLLMNDVKNKKSHPKNPSVTRETQTLIENISFPGKLCVYEADGEFDLRIHMEYAHDKDFDYEDVKFQYRICHTKFQCKKDLMIHIKIDHNESLPPVNIFSLERVNSMQNIAGLIIQNLKT